MKRSCLQIRPINSGIWWILSWIGAILNDWFGCKFFISYVIFRRNGERAPQLKFLVQYGKCNFHLVIGPDICIISHRLCRSVWKPCAVGIQRRDSCVINIWMRYACAALAVKRGLCDSNRSPASALLPPVLQAWSSPGGRSLLRRWWPGPCSGATDRRQTAVPWRDPMWGFTSLHTGWVLCV